MSDLRKAAEMALEVMEYNRANGTPNMGAAIEALRQALAQPEQEYEVTHNEDETFSVGLPDGDELRIVPPKREWVGLTDEEVHEVVSKKWWDWEDAFDIEGFSRAIEAKLKEKNA